MNGINTTMNLWVAVTKNGSVLCYGNPNADLAYHVVDLYWGLFSSKVVNDIKKWRVMEHIKQWNWQCRNKEAWKCKAVKVSITVQEIKKGQNK